jgi:flagellar biosynthesis/type III secretory pathway protein FliH
MMCALKLEVFEVPDAPKSRSTVVMDTGALEEARLQAFEQGYTAGWDDAAANQNEDQTRLKADFARNLQSLGFTFQEARMHVLRSIRPLIEELVTCLLPQVARDALASVALETLMPLADQMADAPVTLVLNPASRTAVETLLEQATGLPLTVIEEPTLGEGQVYLRLGDIETRVDLDGATLQITRAVKDFFDLTEKDERYG